MRNPLVSIIIPTYNRAHLIHETLDSVLAQTYTNWECIVVDDGSTDGTSELLTAYCKKDKRFQYHHRPKDRPKGANACRNYGFELSNGEYINWFDDDDVMHQDKLLIQVDALEKSNFNFSVCQTLIFENHIENIIGLRSKNIISNNIFEDYLTQKIMWMTPSALWRKEFLYKLNYLFDEDLQAAQEWEFHCRVLVNCNIYNVINEPLVYIRQHTESISYNRNNELREHNYFRAREKVYALINKSTFSEKMKKFWGNYYLNHYKKYLFNKNFKKASYILYQYIIFNDEFTLLSRIKMFTAILSFIFFNKGEILFKGIAYK